MQTGRTDHLVVLDHWPPTDIAAAAAAWSQEMGGAAMDHARQLRTCRGVAKQRLHTDQAEKLAAALTRSGAQAWAMSAGMLGQLPRPLVASRLDPNNADVLSAQIALTGPPQTIAWRQVLSLLPARRCESRVVMTKKAKGVSTASMVMAATTGIGAGKALKAIRNKSDKGEQHIDTSARALIEIVAVGPLRRVHAYADRLDYSVLGAQRVQGLQNFTLLLERLRARCRPNLASDSILMGFVADGSLPSMLHVEDNNELAAVSRWLLLRAAARRLHVSL